MCICCSTNSRLRTPRSTFVDVGRNSRSMVSCVISVTCAADHSNIVSDFLITPATNASLKIFLLASQPIRTTETFHVYETRSVFPNWSCREILDGTYCVLKSSLTSSLGFQRDHLLLKLCDNLLNRQCEQTPEESKPDAKPVFLVLLLRQWNCNSPPACLSHEDRCEVSSRFPQASSVATGELPSTTVHHHTTRDEQR